LKVVSMMPARPAPMAAAWASAVCLALPVAFCSTAMSAGVPADEVAGAFGRDHVEVAALGRFDAAEVDVESVAEDEGLALGHVLGDLGLVDAFLELVGDEHLDDLRVLGRVGGGHGLEAVILGEIEVRGAGHLRDDDVDAGITQVLGLGVALAAVADDRERLAAERRQAGVLVVVHFRGHGGSPCVKWRPHCGKRGRQVN
jgi:hypothetical protein